MIKNEIDTKVKLQYWSQDTGYVTIGWLLIALVLAPFIYSTFLLGQEFQGGALCILIPFLLLGLLLAFGIEATRVKIDKSNNILTKTTFTLISRKKKELILKDIAFIVASKRTITRKTKRGTTRMGQEYHITAITKNSEKITLLTTERSVGLLARLWGTPLEAKEVGLKIADFIGVTFTDKIS